MLAASGVGDTLASAFVLRNAPNVNQLSFVSRTWPYLERYAFISRTSGGLSPATRRFISIARRHIATLTPFMARPPEQNRPTAPVREGVRNPVCCLRTCWESDSACLRD